jgi:MazG family protein
MPDSLTDRAAEQFSRLVDVLRTLRSPGGCPWDREQTLESLSPFLLEETYEVLDAIAARDMDALAQEIGDLLFEGAFLAQVASDNGAFDVADALETIVTKLVRRHPHVFGRPLTASSPSTPREVEVRWEELKAAERAQASRPHTTLSGIPRTLPALLRAYEIGQRASAVGFDWEKPSDVIAKVREELDELDEAVRGDGTGSSRAREEMGDVLFALANLARQLGVEPEGALRQANDKFTRRFEALEAAMAAGGRSFKELTLPEMEREWERIKRRETGEKGPVPGISEF